MFWIVFDVFDRIVGRFSCCLARCGLEEALNGTMLSKNRTRVRSFEDYLPQIELGTVPLARFRLHVKTSAKEEVAGGSVRTHGCFENSVFG